MFVKDSGETVLLASISMAFRLRESEELRRILKRISGLCMRKTGIW
jgi:hypothetical protein